ncbi:MAG: type I-E CRISPR-associated protein Cas7/Cse4/CasC [Leptospiraceae bacterium]|nr:type I-E CRISPR-associated protein Cas7/Cse4/CasC [Leptospiraceae bacterium]
MNRFIQLHILTSYPPSNLNRDDLGRPKTAVMGGVNRLRISSQSNKRAWRTSEIFEEKLKGHKGTRTKEMGVKIFEALKEKGVADKSAKDWAKKISEQFGKLKGAKKDKPLEDLEIEQLAHFSPEEEKAIMELVGKLANEKREPAIEELQLLRKENTGADIAMFGRMLASSPLYNKEAAVQVAHAITVHKVAVEDDFFTAVDDLNKNDVDSGAAHLGDTEFGAGLFYLYVCIDRELLKDNLSVNGKTDETLFKNSIQALVESAVKISPTGKQNSFASRARASFLISEKGNEQPRSLSVAFLKPVSGNNFLDDAIKALKDQRDKMDKVYGKCYSSDSSFDVMSGQGSLEEVLKFVVSD